MSEGHLGSLLPIRIINKGPQNIRSSPGISYCQEKGEAGGSQNRNLPLANLPHSSGQTTLQERGAERDRSVNNGGPPALLALCGRAHSPSVLNPKPYVRTWQKDLECSVPLRFFFCMEYIMAQ